METMTTKRKFLLKKRVKTLSTLAYVSMAFFFLYIFFIGVSNKLFGAPLGAFMPIALGIGLLIVPIFAAMLFFMYSQLARQELYNYMRDIKVYRNHKAARRILKAVIDDDFDTAIDLYRKFNLQYDNQLDNYVYGVLIGSLKFSTKYKEIGITKINKLIDSIN